MVASFGPSEVEKDPRPRLAAEKLFLGPKKGQTNCLRSEMSIAQGQKVPFPYLVTKKPKENQTFCLETKPKIF
jgi:hypothetical protein